VLDRELAVMRSNPEAARLFGRSDGDLAGTRITDLLDEASARELPRASCAAVATSRDSRNLVTRARDFS
jgi:hypothetical protein